MSICRCSGLSAALDYHRASIGIRFLKQTMKIQIRTWGAFLSVGLINAGSN
jgi:hypothetical protein